MAARIAVQCGQIQKQMAETVPIFVQRYKVAAPAISNFNLILGMTKMRDVADERSDQSANGAGVDQGSGSRRHASENLSAALKLAAAGLPIFPARVYPEPGSGRWNKRPLVERWQDVATTDPEQIRKWWRAHPSAVPGSELRRAGLVVVDADRHPGAPDGVAAFAALEAENGGLPAHPETDTAGGGKHHFFCRPAGEPLGNRSGALPEGIDVRGTGGWVVAPGSVRPDGARWQAAPSSQPLPDAYRTGTLQPLPDWIVRLIRASRAQHERNERSSRWTNPGGSTREAAYTHATLNRLTNELGCALPGARNNALNRAAFRMGGMIARGWVDHGNVADCLWNACIRNGLVADDGPDAVQATLASGVAAGMRSPHPDLADGPGSYSRAGSDRHSGPEPVQLRPITLGEFLSLDIKPREFVIEPLIHECGLVMVYAWRGVGKTWFALGLGYAIASGGAYLKWVAKKPRRVLHVCGEMPAVDLKQRLSQVVAKRSSLEPGWYRIISADLHEFGIPDLATAEGQAAMDAVLGDAEVIIFDNVSTLFRTGQENESQSWVPVQDWLLKLRREGRSVVIIHHANKGRAQRGTSKREDVLDVVLNLREPSDYEPSEGSRFEVHYEKARGLSGIDAVSPFEAKLEIRDGAFWTMRDIEDARLAEILELKEDDMSVRQIAAELGLSKSAVQRALKKSKKGDA
jgi:hypothetical protein